MVGNAFLFDTHAYLFSRFPTEPSYYGATILLSWNNSQPSHFSDSSRDQWCRHRTYQDLLDVWRTRLSRHTFTEEHLISQPRVRVDTNHASQILDYLVRHCSVLRCYLGDSKQTWLSQIHRFHRQIFGHRPLLHKFWPLESD